jgi:hypothetical protein
MSDEVTPDSVETQRLLELRTFSSFGGIVSGPLPWRGCASYSPLSLATLASSSASRRDRSPFSGAHVPLTPHHK